MVITEVFLKQNRPLLKKWGNTTVSASRTFVRAATTAPRAGKRISRSLRQRSSSDEGIFSKVECLNQFLVVFLR